MQPALLPEPSSSPEDLYSNFSLSLPHPSIRYFRFKVGSSISHRLLMLAHLIVLCMTLKVENSLGLWRKKCFRYVQWSSQCFILGILTCSLTKLPKLGHMNLCWCHPSEAWNYFLEFFSPYQYKRRKACVILQNEIRKHWLPTQNRPTGKNEFLWEELYN